MSDGMSVRASMDVIYAAESSADPHLHGSNTGLFSVGFSVRRESGSGLSGQENTPLSESVRSAAQRMKILALDLFTHCPS